MTVSKNILVIGAGELGDQVILSLAQHPNRENKSISVLLRPSTINTTDTQKAQALQKIRSNNIEFVPGDVTNDTPETLTGIFRNYDTIVSCVGFASGPGTQRKLARAILAAEVPRYVPWQFGVDYDTIGRGSPQELFDEQLDVRDLLRAQTKTSWVIVSTGMFTSFLFEPWFGVVDLENNKVTGLGSLETRVTVTSPEDIGKITADAVLGPHADDAFGNQPIYIAGDTLAYGQLPELLEKVTGRTFTSGVRTVEAAKADLAKDPGNVLYKYEAIFGAGKGVAWDVKDTWNYKYGIRTETAEEWAAAHLGSK